MPLWTYELLQISLSNISIKSSFNVNTEVNFIHLSYASPGPVAYLWAQAFSNLSRLLNNESPSCSLFVQSIKIGLSWRVTIVKSPEVGKYRWCQCLTLPSWLMVVSIPLKATFHLKKHSTLMSRSRHRSTASGFADITLSGTVLVARKRGSLKRTIMPLTHFQCTLATLQPTPCPRCYPSGNILSLWTCPHPFQSGRSPCNCRRQSHRWEWRQVQCSLPETLWRHREEKDQCSQSLKSRALDKLEKKSPSVRSLQRQSGRLVEPSHVLSSWHLSEINS